jgi:hypothetical protein
MQNSCVHQGTGVVDDSAIGESTEQRHEGELHHEGRKRGFTNDAIDFLVPCVGFVVLFDPG